MSLLDKIRRTSNFGIPVRIEWWDAWDTVGDWEKLDSISSFSEMCDSYTHEEVGFYLGEDEKFTYTCQLMNLPASEVRNVSAIPTYAITRKEFLTHTKETHHDTTILPRPERTNP